MRIYSRHFRTSIWTDRRSLMRLRRSTVGWRCLISTGIRRPSSARRATAWLIALASRTGSTSYSRSSTPASTRVCYLTSTWPPPEVQNHDARLSGNDRRRAARKTHLSLRPRSPSRVPLRRNTKRFRTRCIRSACSP